MKTKPYLRICLAILIIVSCHLTFAQSIKFTRAFGGTGNDYGYSVQQTYDNGYIIAGSTTSYGSGGSDVHLLKIDSLGYFLWQKTFGGINIDKGFSVKETADSGLVIAGYTNSSGLGGYDMYVIRTNKIGDTLWTKTYGGNDWDFGNSIELTSDGGYIVAGGTFSLGSGNEDMYLVKIDASGNVQWTETYGGTNDEEAKSVKQTSDGGYILLGKTKSFGDTNGDFYVVKTNSTGGTTWTKKYGGALEENPGEIIEAANGNYIFTGGTLSYGVGERVYLMRLSSIGDSLWSRVYGGPNYTYSSSLVETASGKIIFANTTANSGAGLKDAALFVADQDGWYINSTSYGSSSNDEAFSLSKCKDNGFIICGYTEGFSSVFSNVFVVKTDSMGSSAPFTTSIYEINRATNSFAVYPNPAQSSGEITLSFFDHIKLTSNCELLLTDVTGRLIKQIIVTPSDKTMSFSLDNIESGIYFISIIDSGIIIGRVKFISTK